MNLWNKTKALFARNTDTVSEDVFNLGFDSGPSAASRRLDVKGWLEKYGTNAALQMVARRVASDVALVKWHLYKRLPGEAGPQGPPKEEIFDHPLLKIWKRPNPMIVGFQFRYLIQLYLELQGECHIIIQRKPGTLQPEALWPVPKTWVAQCPTPEAPYWRFTLGKSLSEPIPPGEVMWLHDPDPLNPYARGLGVARSLDDEVSQDEWMNKFNSQFFRKGAHPGAVIAMEGVAPEVAEKIKANYEQKYSGFWNAFKTAWIGVPRQGKVHFKQLTSSHKDMDFNEGKRQKRDAILQAWNMQRFEVGINEDVNRASAQASADGKARNVTLPRVVYLEEAFEIYLVPLFGDSSLMLTAENPVKETEEFRLAKSSEGWITGAITRNEWRKENGFDPLPPEQGDVLQPPLNVGNERVKSRAMVLGELKKLDPEAAALLERTWNP
jgi:HK97 family phage portal protein